MTTIVVQNEKDTLLTSVAVADLRHVVTESDPQFGVLNEWPRSRDRATRKMLASLGYGYGRPLRGGGPVFWEKSTAKKRRIRSKMIARPAFMGRLPGRRSLLGPSWLTVALFDLLSGGQLALDGFHLTAEVQDVRGGGGYKKDRAHRRRVKRHIGERDKTGEIGRRQLERGVDAHPAGDTNFEDMVLPGFVNSWVGHPGGDLGGRAVTICYGKTRAKRVRTIKTHSDHLTVVVTY